MTLRFVSQSKVRLRAALVAVSAGGVVFSLPVRLSAADSGLEGAITVRVIGLRSNDGQVGCSLFRSAEGFPKDLNAVTERLFCPIRSNASTCIFRPVARGTYAIACFHDENKNGRLDTGFLGIPKEGVCVSNNAAGKMGPPSFDDAKFETSGIPREISVRMRYWRHVK
jgi:uncharacterized protein (DUF2141 family)